MKLSKVHEEAANLLSALASQPEWHHFVADMPGSWSLKSRTIASSAWDARAEQADFDETSEHHDLYAEAEALIRDGSVR